MLNMTEDMRVAGLKNAYRNRSKDIRSRVASLTRQAKDSLARNVEIVRRDADLQFAALLKQAVDNGVPVTRVRREVLGTNTWSVWKKWRDLAGLESKYVSREDKEYEF